MKVKSKKPKKQRKALYNFKNHQRSKLMSMRLADFLVDELGVRRLPCRIGDNVKICKGEFRDMESEILEITKDLRVKLKDCVYDKADGTQYRPAIHPSNCILVKLKKPKKMDPWRAGIIESKAGFKPWDELTAPKKEKRED